MKRLLLILTAMVVAAFPINASAAWGKPARLGPTLNRSLEPDRTPGFLEPDSLMLEADASPLANYNYDELPRFDNAAEAGRYWAECVRDRLPDFAMVIEGHGEHENEVRWQDVANEYYNDIIDEGLRHTGEPDKGDYLRQIGDTYGGMLSCAFVKGEAGKRLIDGYIISYEPGFYYSSAEQEAQVGGLVEELIDELGIRSPRISPYEKISAVYDWLCENVTYDYENLYDDTYYVKHSAYAAIKDRTCVCSGYALLFYRMMLTLGIDCRYITGYVAGGYHAWNIVNLYGEYFLLDATWDAGAVNYEYYLLGTNSAYADRDFDDEFTSDSFKKAYNVPLCAYSVHAGERIGAADPDCAHSGRTGGGECSVCGAVLEDFELSAKGHRFENGVCTVCQRTEPPRGDLNDDGEINISDGVIMQRILAGLDQNVETSDFADFDKNGQTNVADGILMQQILAGLG